MSLHDRVTSLERQLRVLRRELKHLRINQLLRDRQNVTHATDAPSPTQLHRLLEAVCSRRYPGHSALDVDGWVRKVKDKLHLVGVYNVDHLRRNLPRINYMLNRVDRRGFYGRTLQVMTELIESNSYDEPTQATACSPSAFITKAVPSEEPRSTKLFGRN